MVGLKTMKPLRYSGILQRIYKKNMAEGEITDERMWLQVRVQDRTMWLQEEG